MRFTLVCRVPPGVGDGVGVGPGGVGVGVAPPLLVLAATPLPAHPAIARPAIATRTASAKVRCIYVIWGVQPGYGISRRVRAFFAFESLGCAATLLCWPQCLLISN